MRNRSLNAIHVTLLAMVLLFAGALQAQWTPGGNSTTADISRTGKVGVMTTGTPASQFHVFTATSMDGIAVDGSNNPAINFRNAGSIKGYLGLATAANAFFSGSAVNDLVLRSESGKIHLGVGSSAPTMTVSNGSVTIGTTSAPFTFYGYAANTGAASKVTGGLEISVAPTTAQTGAGIHNTALNGYASVPLGTAVGVGTVTGSEGDSENYAATSISSMIGTWGWAYNQNPSATVNSISGTDGWVEVDGGSVNYAAEFWGWAGVYGGTVANLYGAFLAPNNVSGTVTNSFGVFVSPQGAATNRYGVYINDGAGVATNDYGLYQNGSTKKNYFAGNVGIGTTSPTAPLTVNGQVYSQSGGFKFPDGTVQTTASTGGGSGSVTAANVSSGNFGANSSGGNYTFPAMVGVGTTGTPSNQLHVITATNMDGIAVDGSNSPAVNLRNAGAIKGYLGLATSANAFFAGSVANDLVLRSEGGKIHIGQGSGAPAMTVAGNSLGIGTTAPYYPFHLSMTNTDTTGGSTQSGGNRKWWSASEVDLTIKPTAAQATGAVRIGQEAWSQVDSTNTYSIGTVRGGEGDAENYGSGAVSNLTGITGWAYNGNNSAHVTEIVGASAATENDGGTVDSMYNLTTWGGVLGGSVTNQYGIYNQASGSGGAGTVTNQYGIYSLLNGNATTRYNLFLHNGTGVATNNWGLYQDDSTAKNYFAGTLGIGTTSPTSPLTVNGVIQSQTGGFKFPDGTVQTTAATSGGGSGSVTAANVSAGNFGANSSGGNFSFPARLDVASGGVTPRGSDTDVVIGSTVPQVEFYTPSASAVFAYDGNYMRLLTNGPSWNSAMLWGNDGKVGIASLPTFKFEVAHSSTSTAYANDTTQFGMGLINSSGTPDSWSNISFAQQGAGSVLASVGAQFHAGNVTDLVFGTQTGTVLTEKMRITGAGKVGIGASIPTFKAEIAHTSSSTTFLNDPTQVGLGLINSSGTVDSYSDLTFAQAGAGAVKASVGAQFHANNNTDLVFGTQTSAGGVTEKMRITGAGAVGIGTTPGAGYALDVNGAIHSSGAITGTAVYATFQDVAEWVPASPDAVEAGTVVVLDPEKGNGVMASSEAYDTTVAGVVSAHPGIILGKPGEGKAQVATTGRVKVKVDANKGAIRVGDLLVTSDVAGTAMKSVPMIVNGRRFHQPGTIIGKALEPLASGTGEILVLLSLQ